MKKLLILMLVIGMASFASAALTDVFSVVDTTGSSPYDVDDIVNLKIVLNSGWEIDSYDVQLTHSTTATCDGDFWTVGNNTVSQIAGGWAEADKVTTTTVDGSDMNMMGTWQGAADIMWNFGIKVTEGKVGENIALTLKASGSGFRYRETGETDWETAPSGATLDTEDLPTTPEPMTIALLGLGGLFLRRRK